MTSHSSPTAWLYLSLHGTYGIVWLLKECIFPDPSWQEKITVVSWLNQFASVLGPYWVAAWITVAKRSWICRMISNFFLWLLQYYRVELTPKEMALCIIVHTLGVVTMMCADCQKFYTLKYQKVCDDHRNNHADGIAYCLTLAGIDFWRLVFADTKPKLSWWNDDLWNVCVHFKGLEKNSTEAMYRNSFTNLQHWAPWCIVGYVWGLLFMSNMIAKEGSLRRKSGWEDYGRRSGFLIPKLFWILWLQNESWKPGEDLPPSVCLLTVNNNTGISASFVNDLSTSARNDPSGFDGKYFQCVLCHQQHSY